MDHFLSATFEDADDLDFPVFENSYQGSCIAILAVSKTGRIDLNRGGDSLGCNPSFTVGYPSLLDLFVVLSGTLTKWLALGFLVSAFKLALCGINPVTKRLIGWLCFQSVLEDSRVF